MSNEPTPIGPHGSIVASEHDDGITIAQADRQPHTLLHLTDQEAAHLLRWLGSRAARIAAAGDEPVCTIDLALRDDAANALWSRSKTMPAPKKLAENVNIVTISTVTMRNLLDHAVDEHNDPTINDAMLRLAEAPPAAPGSSPLE